jgi:ankyrin repeat protein
MREAQGKDAVPMVRALLAWQPDLEWRNRDRLTPLQLAVSRGAEKVAALLAEVGANVNAVWSGGETPLFWAVEKKMRDTVKILLERKANPNAPNLTGRTPLDTVSAALRSNRDDPAWIEIDALLREAGASEEFSRRFFITVTRKARGLAHQAFYKGTNDFNRYTLFELVATFFQGGNGLPGYALKFDFVDFAHVKITRLKPEGGTSEFTVDLAAAFKSGVCTNDMTLEWGDVVDFPELDHPLNLGWSGLDPATRALLRKCLERKVEIVVKGETTTATLRPSFPVYRDEPVPKVSEGLLMAAFRLGEVVRNSGLLRSSSDISRVKVKRTDPETGRKLELVFDLEKISPSTDLWLREGDVIEIPERDPNAPPRAASSGIQLSPAPSSFPAPPAPALNPVSPPRILPPRQVRPNPPKD